MESEDSPFWNTQWLAFDINESEAPGGSLGSDSEDVSFFSASMPGLWSICGHDGGLASKIKDETISGAAEAITVYESFNPSVIYPGSTEVADKTYSTLDCSDGTKNSGEEMYQSAIFCSGTTDDHEKCDDVVSEAKMHMPRLCQNACGYDCGLGGDDPKICVNIASRMSQKEALHHAQAAYFISIIVVQWADLLICKTRWLSLRTQGLTNVMMNFGLFFETLLGAILCYILPINTALGTRNLRFTHWLPGIPWSILIFTYDEIRKYLMRTTSPETVDPVTGQVVRLKGWIERNTYY